ncbi:hypothetical protein SB861_36690 [Paraburkholderia sp. SIMBA_049]
MPVSRTTGGHRRNRHDTVRTVVGIERVTNGKTICCAHISSHDQAGQLETHASSLQKHALKFFSYDVEQHPVFNLFSGLNALSPTYEL